MVDLPTLGRPTIPQFNGKGRSFIVRARFECLKTAIRKKAVLYRIVDAPPLRLVLGLEAAGLHAVAANLHVAPAAGVVFAGVEEEPAALWDGAGANGVSGFAGEQVDGGLREQPEREMRCSHVGPGKLEAGTCPVEAAFGQRAAEMSIEFFYRSLRWSEAID